MRGGTLFSGIGAPEVAAPWVDWRWSADVDDFANAVRAHHWPDVPNLGNVGAIGHDAVEPVDLVVFGSPCQSFSVAGKRLGLDDPRGNLALVALRLVASIRPRWFVFENVPGLLSSADGEDFAAFLRAVRQCGYSGAYRVLDAQYLGVPQRRRRVFFVGHLGDDWRPSAAVLFEPESLRGDTAPSREARQDAAPTISARPTGGGGLGTDFDLDGGLHVIKGAAIGRRPENGPQYGDHLSDGTCYTLNCTEQHAVASTGHVSHCLNADGMGRQDFETETLVAFGTSGYGASEGPVAPTLDASSAKLSNQVQGVTDGHMVRRLTPTECERLQGFPDGFTAIPWRNGTAPDGRRYKALGNSMAVPVVAWITDRIRMFEQEASLPMAAE